MGAPIDLNLFRIFVAVHEGASFTAAAQRLGVPRSTVSRAIVALEASLNVQLFRRSTRHVATTPEGLALFARAAPSLEVIATALSATAARDTEPLGTLRVTSTADLGAAVLAEAASRYTARYTRSDVDLVLSTRLVDLMREDVDVALRVYTAARHDSALVARRVGHLELRMYASPGYLARRGVPKTRDDLSLHDQVELATPDRTNAKKPRRPPRVRVRCDDATTLREVLRTGGGIGALPSFLAEGDVASGALVHVLPKWAVLTGAVYLVHAGGRHVPPKVSAFRDIVIELLRLRPVLTPRAYELGTAPKPRAVDTRRAVR